MLLDRCGHPISVRSLFRYHHRHLHHRAQDIESGQTSVFIDASALFTRGGNKNKLFLDHQQTILNACTGRTDFDHVVLLVPNSEIVENRYNIAVSSSVEQENTHGMVAIMVLNTEIERIVTPRAASRTRIDTIMAYLEETPA